MQSCGGGEAALAAVADAAAAAAADARLADLARREAELADGVRAVLRPRGAAAAGAAAAAGRCVGCALGSTARRQVMYIT